MRLAESFLLLCAALCSDIGTLVSSASSSSSSSCSSSFLSSSSSLPPLVFANRKDIQLVRQRGNGGGGNATVLVGGLEDAVAMDFLAPSSSSSSSSCHPGFLFWTDVSLSVIRRVPLNDTGNVEDIASTGLVAPDGLACDWLGRKLYWTDWETDRIEVAEFDGSQRKVLIWEELEQPRAIALDPANGYMYWTDWGEEPKIERVGMDGSPDTRAVLIDKDIFWPNGITLDYVENRLYWADAKLRSITSCRYDGSDRQVVIRGTLPHPFAMTLLGDRIYWTDWKLRAINSCNKRTCRDNRTVTVLSHIYSPMDIHVFSPLRQPTGTSPCGTNNGGCSDLCLMSPHPPHYSCACPTGVPMLQDGTNKTCAKGASEVVLLARRWDIRRISLETPDHTDVVLPLHNLQHTIAIDYDPVDGHVYWTDDKVRLIRRAYLDGSGQEVVISSEIDHPDGVAVDWVARNLYWTDTGTDRIEVSRLNGTARRTLISTGLREPRAIVLDPEQGYMYWTDWGYEPKIERAALDGSGREVLVNTSLGWPNGLALDPEEGRLYWGDAKTDVIEVVDLDGSNRRTLISDLVPHIFGLSLLGDYIYWTDWQKRSVERVNKYTGQERERIIEELPDIMGLRAVNVNKKDGWNPCHGDAYGCSHLCLYRPAGPVCACPMGLELLADGKTCIVPEAFLLFSLSKDIRRISLEINNNDVLIPLSGVQAALALDFDINDNRIYWTDTSLKMISRAFMNGSAHENVVSFGLDNPEGMAVDWVAHNLYWADSGTQRVEMSRLDGSSRRVLLWKDVSEPRSIALDPQRGHMYWSDWGKKSLERTSLDGTDRQVILQQRARRNSLTIDHSEQRLYWTNIDTNQIESSDLDGGNVRVLYQNAPYKPYSLTQYADFVYWTDWQTMSIDRANKTNGDNRTRIQGQLEYIMDILVFHESRQLGWNRCGVDNGGCSHLCIAHGGGGGVGELGNATIPGSNAHHCACPTHYTLMDDGKSCKAAESFLLFSRKTSVSRLVVNEGSNTDDAPDVVLPVQSVRNVRALAFDPRQHYIYWVDGKTKSIRRALQDGRNGTVVVANPRSEVIHMPYDVAVDPYARLLYWSDSRNNVINVTRLDDLWPVGVVVSSQPRDEQEPREIALAPRQGYMFWSNVAHQPRIERADMDGTTRLTLFTTELGSVETLTVDPSSQTLYWADKEYERIEMAHFDGSDRRVLIEAYFKQPVGMAIFDDFLFWADREMKIIERVHKTNGQDRGQILTRVPNLSDLVAVTTLSDREIESQPCSHNNGGCSHLCVVEDGGSGGGSGGKTKRRCSCPMGLMLAAEDMRTCLEPPTCDATQFTCTSGECLPLHFQCDGSSDCKDKSDEVNCERCINKCGTTGECITTDMRCNGISECEDGTDERGCAPCKAAMFGCKVGGMCILPHQICNGHADCPGADDENNCDNYTNGLSGLQHTGNVTNWMLIVGIALSALVIVLVVILFKKRKRQPLNENDDVFFACKPVSNVTLVSAYSSTNGAPPPLQPGSQQPPLLSHATKTSASGYTGPTESALSTASPGMYDRDRLTGASSNSSGLQSQHYPYETLNPPPSPVTERDGSSLYSAASSILPPSSYTSSTHHHHRHRNGGNNRGRGRYVHIPPLPTPCSTDVCDDSESYVDDVTPLRRKHGGVSAAMMMASARNNGGIDYDDSDSYAAYSPHPPPCPTPRSQYFSDPSCPPSPLTERSFNPYPPPPSPVGTSDC